MAAILSRGQDLITRISYRSSRVAGLRPVSCSRAATSGWSPQVVYIFRRLLNYYTALTCRYYGCHWDMRHGPQLAGITLQWFAGLNIGLYCLGRNGRNGLWVAMVCGNFHYFSKAIDSPLYIQYLVANGHSQGCARRLWKSLHACLRAWASLLPTHIASAQQQWHQWHGTKKHYKEIIWNKWLHCFFGLLTIIFCSRKQQWDASSCRISLQ